jgi:hypothetical protein
MLGYLSEKSIKGDDVVEIKKQIEQHENVLPKHAQFDNES